MILKNCAYVVTQNNDREILKDVDIKIENGKIVKIEKNIRDHGERHDFSEKVVLPGMINTHTHLPMTLFRGYYDNMRLHKWLDVVMKHELKLTKEHIFYGTLLGCIESIQNGTTTVADFYYFPYVREKALIKSGINAFIDSTVLDNPLFFKDTKEALDAQESFVKDFLKRGSPVRPIATAHSAYLCGKKTLERVRDISNKYEVLRRIHISETEKEFKRSLATHKMTPIEFLESIDWLDEKTLLVHANWITNKEIKMVAEKDCKVCHNPISNMKLAYGKFMPLKKMLDNRITVGLATDGATSNNSLDMFGDLKVCALDNKFFGGTPAEVPDQQVFDLANINAAKVLMIEDETGSIEVGKRADLITLNLYSSKLTPTNEHNSIISHVLYCINGSDVVDTIANGRFLMRDKILMTLDTRSIIKKVQALMNQKEVS